MIEQDYIKDCLIYCGDTGVFTWKARPLHHFKNKSYMDRWNKKYAENAINNKPVSNGWSNKYIRIAINNKKYFAHRLAALYVFGDIKGKQVDHINGNTSDNRIKNLRLVSAIENRKNSRLNARNKTGVSGVTWLKKRQKYRVRVKDNYSLVVDQEFDDFFLACCKRKSSEIKYGYHKNHGKSV